MARTTASAVRGGRGPGPRGRGGRRWRSRRRSAPGRPRRHRSRGRRCRRGGRRPRAPRRSGAPGRPPSRRRASDAESKGIRSMSVHEVAWVAPPSSWLRAPSGLTTRPTSATTSSRVTTHLAGDLDVGDDRAVGAAVLVAGVGQAATDVIGQLLVPAAQPGGLGDDVPGPGVGEVVEPERHRVDAGDRGQLVHERLDREDVEVGPERAHRRGAQRGVGLAVADHASRAPRRTPGRRCGSCRRRPPGAGRSTGRAAPRRRGRRGCEQPAVGRRSRGARVWPGAPDVVATSRRSVRRRAGHAASRVIAGASGPQVSSSGRVQRSSTGRPGTARASSTASKAASSAALWP